MIKWSTKDTCSQLIRPRPGPLLGPISMCLVGCCRCSTHKPDRRSCRNYGRHYIKVWHHGCPRRKLRIIEYTFDKAQCAEKLYVEGSNGGDRGRDESKYQDHRLIGTPVRGSKWSACSNLEGVPDEIRLSSSIHDHSQCHHNPLQGLDFNVRPIVSRKRPIVTGDDNPMIRPGSLGPILRG